MMWTMMSLNWRAEGIVFVCSDVRHGTKSSALGAAAHRVCRETHLNSVTLFVVLFYRQGVSGNDLFFLEDTCGQRRKT